VRSDGTAKVLDFGLTKAMEPTDAMSASVAMSPTITTPAMTQAGMILGTAAYMSLEQARGIDEDGASDHSYRAVFSALDADKVDQTAGMLAEPPTPQRAAHRPALTSRAPRSPYGDRRLPGGIRGASLT